MSKDQHNPAETVVAAGLQVKGNLTCEGDLWFDGTIVGNIRSEGSVTIGNNATIEGHIECANLTVAGHIRGNLKIKDHLVVQASGLIIGDVNTRDLAVASGAVLIGQVAMPNPAAAFEQASPELKQDAPTDEV